MGIYTTRERTHRHSRVVQLVADCAPHLDLVSLSLSYPVAHILDAIIALVFVCDPASGTLIELHTQ